MGWDIVIKFGALLLFVSGGIIVLLHRVFFAGVENAKQRLEHDAEAARAREVELNRKIRQADEELAQRKRELDAIEQKMKGELEAEAVKHKEELVAKARVEAEDIITKAQNAADGVRREIEKNMEIKIIDYSCKILDEILTKKAGKALERDLVDEFIAQLQNVDMSKISPEIKQAEIQTVHGMDDTDLKRIGAIIKSKIGRDLAVQSKEAPEHLSGVILKFGSLQLDGSLRMAMQDCAIALKTQVEKSYQDKK